MDDRDDAGRSSKPWHVLARVALILSCLAALVAIFNFIGPIVNATHSSNPNGGHTGRMATPPLVASPTTPATSTSEPTPTDTPTPLPTATATPQAVPSTTTYQEGAGPNGSPTFTDYTSAGGTQGPRIDANGTVEVSCRIEGWKSPTAPSGDNWWYRVESNPWNDAFYAYADNFYNVWPPTGPINNGVLVDTKVPLC